MLNSPAGILTWPPPELPTVSTAACSCAVMSPDPVIATGLQGTDPRLREPRKYPAYEKSSRFQVRPAKATGCGVYTPLVNGNSREFQDGAPEPEDIDSLDCDLL